jgi:hypothetical protein
VKLRPLKPLPGTPLELLPEHVSRYDDAGPIRNIMDRPDQQSHPITRSLAILLTALLESATASVNVRFNHHLMVYKRRRAIEIASNTIVRRTSRDKKYDTI